MEADKDLYELPINDLYLQRAYQGSVADYKTGLRGLKSGEPDTLAAREIRFLQRRNQDIIRNNGYGRIALNTFKTKLGCSKVIWKDRKGKEHRLFKVSPTVLYTLMELVLFVFWLFALVIELKFL
jgi:hypothetical protein